MNLAADLPVEATAAGGLWRSAAFTTRITRDLHVHRGVTNGIAGMTVTIVHPDKEDTVPHISSSIFCYKVTINHHFCR